MSQCAVVQHFKAQEGIDFRTVEPFNESTAGWWHYGDPQEGYYCDPRYQAWIIGSVGRALAERNLSTRISASDENSIDSTLACFRSYPQEAKDFITQINTHSYNGTERTDLAATAAASHKTLWQSEYGDADATGITLSWKIVDDLRHLHPAAWIYWQAVDGAKWGLLTNDMEGIPSASKPVLGKKYWVMTNYSRFIRPGSVFIDISDEHSVAALDATGNTLTIVTTNWDDHDEKINYDLSHLDTSFATLTAYRTSTNEDLAQLSDIALTEGHLESVLPGKSVTTFVIRGVSSRE